MPRRARALIGGLPYHVLNRANGRLRLFRKEADFAAFERIVRETLQTTPLRILGYVVMSNHWHFVVWPRRDEGPLVSEFFRRLTVTHAQRRHAHLGTAGTGHVYQGRFKSFRSQFVEDSYLIVSQSACVLGYNLLATARFARVRSPRLRITPARPLTTPKITCSMSNRNYLFRGADWFATQEKIFATIKEEIAALPGDRLLNTPVDDLIAYFVSKYSLSVPVLRRDEISVAQTEEHIDVRYDRDRYISDRSQPVYIPGVAIHVNVPYDGDSNLFRLRASMFTINPPAADVDGQKLHFAISGITLDPDAVRNEINKCVADIETHLEWLRKDATPFNEQLPAHARSLIENRRNKLLADRNLVASLGFPMRERPDTSRTFVPSDVRKKLSPQLPPTTSAPYKPEPALSKDDYEYILKVLQNMVHVMERSPKAFVTMDEESLRSHFLVHLNGHYEGQATGETFNYQGKTDILVRSEGRNIFIAECKFWGGPKVLVETLDQVLGYTSWRDTKVAVLIFNRNKNFSQVLSSIAATATQHPCFKRSLSGSEETVFRYAFRHRDDPSREMLLTILAFDLPAAP